jgi:hypothetical protein
MNAALMLRPGRAGVRGHTRRRGAGEEAAGSGWERSGGRTGGAGREFGINGGSSGKDGVIILGDHAPVFSELRQVTCGLAVHTAVHNRRDVRITDGILWTRCGQEKN